MLDANDTVHSHDDVSSKSPNLKLRDLLDHAQVRHFPGRSGGGIGMSDIRVWEVWLWRER